MLNAERFYVECGTVLRRIGYGFTLNRERFRMYYRILCSSNTEQFLHQIWNGIALILNNTCAHIHMHHTLTHHPQT